jgi:hypothetical protein
MAVAKANGEFLKDGRWKEVFIPTLTHAFYISREPFLDWTSESLTLLANVQEVFDITFTNVDVNLSSKDSVITTVCQIYVPIPLPDFLTFSNLATWQACSRIKSRKSKLAAAVLDNIKTFFEGPEFVGKPAKIREYVRWALRTGGPAYYAVPIPKEGTANREHPHYIVSFLSPSVSVRLTYYIQPPEGFLESEFIAPIAKQYYKYAHNSVLRPQLDAKNPPKALYALILLAVCFFF